MKNTTRLPLLLCFSLCASNASGFTPMHKNVLSNTQMNMGLFDDLNLIFSEEGKKNRAAFEDEQRREQEAAQREIMERRRNPDKMQQYDQDVKQRRKKLDEDRSLWNFQKENGMDPMQKWKELRSEGKIKAGSDIERDPTSSRLGSEGLQEIRTDDKLPYIEQGYVDEDADVIGNFMKMFGKKK